MVTFDSVGLRYGTPSGRDAMPAALHEISFEVPKGQFRWLLGPSGAGKTSLMRLLHLAALPTSGELMLLGTDVNRSTRRDRQRLRRQIGVVFQDFRLLPYLTAFENVALPLRLAGMAEPQVQVDVTELLRWVGMARKLDVLPDALSGGEQQRVAIARAVIGRPQLLLADEPTGNLDSGQADRLMTLLRQMNTLGTTVIVATHNEALVKANPAPALRLNQGRLVNEA